MLKKILLGIVAILVVGYVAAITLPFDPNERRPGATLSGEFASEQNPDWQAHYDGRKKVHLQTRTWYPVPHSVTTTSWVYDGMLYVPCGRCSSKRWPLNVAADNRVRVRVDGKLYDKRAVLITDEAQRITLLGNRPAEELAGVAVYRIDPV